MDLSSLLSSPLFWVIILGLLIGLFIKISASGNKQKKQKGFKVYYAKTRQERRHIREKTRRD